MAGRLCNNGIGVQSGIQSGSNIHVQTVEQDVIVMVMKLGWEDTLLLRSAYEIYLLSGSFTTGQADPTLLDFQKRSSSTYFMAIIRITNRWNGELALFILPL